MVTTIQISESLKDRLVALKRSHKDSYEDVIAAALNRQEKELTDYEKNMAEGYIEMAEETMKIMDEFKYADAEIDWEWDGDL